MPILTVRLATSRYSDEQLKTFTTRASQIYAEILEAPIDRIRVFLQDCPQSHMAIGGIVATENDGDAPFFECLLMLGRPAEQKHRLFAAVTDLIQEVFQIDRNLIRGNARHVDPDDWCISGSTAGVLRAAEIAARQQA